MIEADVLQGRAGGGVANSNGHVYVLRYFFTEAAAPHTSQSKTVLNPYAFGHIPCYMNNKSEQGDLNCEGARERVDFQPNDQVRSDNLKCQYGTCTPILQNMDCSIYTK